jgi:hypothetical protein
MFQTLQQKIFFHIILIQPYIPGVGYLWPR